MHDITHRQDINNLVAAFYNKAITDPTIGHIFTDVAQLNLATHIPKICDFWESILLGNPIYRGNPMLKHLELAEKTALTQVQHSGTRGLTGVHFEVWLSLWEGTVRELFTGDKAELAIRRAKDIGRLMLYKIDQRR